MEGGSFFMPMGKDARMRHFNFSPDVLAAIQRDRFNHVDPLVQRRMEVLLLKAHGQPHAMIAKIANLSRATVQRILGPVRSRRLGDGADISLENPCQCVDAASALVGGGIQGPPAAYRGRGVRAD